MSSIAPKMSDFGKHSNARPRPLGVVKAESVCFYFLDNNPTITRTFQSAGDIDKRQLIMNRLHENLITTALIADVSSANAVDETFKKSGNAQNHVALGSSFSAMNLISSLVSPRPRIISIPKQRNADFQEYDLRINTAPNPESEMDSLGMYDSQRETIVSNGHHNAQEWQKTHSSSRHSSNWREYRRQLSTAKKKEITRKLTEISKCEAVDIMDPAQTSPPRNTSPMIIMSQYKRDEENDVLNATADAILQRSGRIPSVCSAKYKRPTTLVRETGVFSRSMKNQNGQQEIGQIPDGIVGKNISNFGLAPESGLGDEYMYTSRAGGSPRLWKRHVSYHDRNHATTDGQGSKSKHVSSLNGHMLQTPSARIIKDRKFNLSGKSLPRLPKQNSYTDNLRLLQKKKQNGHLPPEFDEYEHLRQHLHMTLSHTDTFWTIPEGLAEIPDHRNVPNGFRASRKIPTKLPPYDETQRAQTLTCKRNKTPNYKSYRDNLAARKEINYDQNGQLNDYMDENAKDSELHATFRLTELHEDDIMDLDSDGDDLTDTDEDVDERITPIRLCDDHLTRQPLGTGRYQGTTSRISENEVGSQFHLVNGENCDVQHETYKILKALDKDVYFDYEHKKYRRTGTVGSLGNPQNPRVHFFKVKLNKYLTD